MGDIEMKAFRKLCAALLILALLLAAVGCGGASGKKDSEYVER